MSIAQAEQTAPLPTTDVRKAPTSTLYVAALVAAFLVAGFWTVAVLIGTANAVSSAYSDMRSDIAVNNDFPMFYAGAANVISGQREDSYDKQFIVESIRDRWVDPES